MSQKSGDRRRPVIGIPAALGTPNERGYVHQQVGAPYVRALEGCGAIPVVLPVIHDREAIRRMLDMVDGVLFQGGGDIAPHLYGQEQHPSVTLVNEDTDRFELALCQECLERDMPVLAICRGVQVLNVAAGGTLVQDIPSEVPTANSHRQTAPRDQPSHPIEVRPGSRLASILGHGPVGVNSMHHQSLGQLGSGLEISATSDDAIVEAVEAPDRRFVVGVQFHPEETVKSVPATARLFEELVEAARQRDTACRS